LEVDLVIEGIYWLLFTYTLRDYPRVLPGYELEPEHGSAEEPQTLKPPIFFIGVLRPLLLDGSRKSRIVELSYDKQGQHGRTESHHKPHRMLKLITRHARPLPRNTPVLPLSLAEGHRRTCDT